MGISATEFEEVFGISQEEWDPAIPQIAEDIESIVELKPFLDAVLPDLYTSHLNGDDIRDPFYSLVQEQVEFGRVTAYIYRRTTDAVAGARILATIARNTGEIDDATHRDFVDLWEEHNWIAEAVPVAIQQEDGYQYWTGHGVDVQYRENDSTMYVDWVAKQGVDDLWDIQAPMPSVLSMFASVTRFQEERLEAFLDNRGGSLGLEGRTSRRSTRRSRC
ncbi:hypothetical protein [Halosegnis marinus]|uniref:hypothetical protein n=1 Tax=Halosegnis marinus TaxID=3034023 RepID=UPI0036230C55